MVIFFLFSNHSNPKAISSAFFMPHGLSFQESMVFMPQVKPVLSSSSTNRTNGLHYPLPRILHQRQSPYLCPYKTALSLQIALGEYIHERIFC